ncbi:MAG TPA: toll/interleukin-1 receptor domain-containing protein [Pyrinomonadaceae bacterium]
MSVFISYSRSDSAFVNDLANRLREAGCKVWQDISGLRGGQTWTSAIDRAVRDSDALIVVLSPDSSASEWVRKETLLAMKLHKPIVPILLRETEIPVQFVDLQFVDFRGDTAEATLRLFEAISTSLASPTTIPKRPPIRRYDKPLAFFLLGAIILGAIAYIIKFRISPGNCLEQEFAGVNPIEVGSGIQPLRELRDGMIKIKLTDNRQPVGALRLKFYPVGEYFEIEKVFDSRCNVVEDLFNLSRQTYIDIKKDKVPNNDYVQLPLGGQNYSLRLMFQERASALFEKR